MGHLFKIELNNLVKNNFKSVTIAKTYPEPKLIKLIGNELNLSNIIVLLDSIIIKKTEIYNCVNIKYVFEMCSKNTYLNVPDTNKIIIKSKKIIIEAVKEDFRAIEYASDDLKNDKDVFLIANDTWGGLISLQHFSESIKDDKDLVLSAVKKKWIGFEICQ